MELTKGDWLEGECPEAVTSWRDTFYSELQQRPGVWRVARTWTPDDGVTKQVLYTETSVWNRRYENVEAVTRGDAVYVRFVQDSTAV